MYRVTIITACYNSAKTINQTIASVLNQDYANIEYIVIDGLSNDGTQDIVKSYGDRISRFISEKDKGIYDAFNKGIKHATGEIIGFIGSDDYYPNDGIISKVAEAFLRNNSDSLYGDKQYVDKQDRIVRYWTAGNYNPSRFLLGWMPPHLSFYLKKDIYNKFGLYREDFSIAGDYELMLRMLYKNHITTQYLPEILITMRTGGASTRNFHSRIKANMEDRRAWHVNGLKPKFYTLFLKPLLKIPQFLKRVP